MKNFPHQFNDLDKLYKALGLIKELIEEEIPLKDDNFGELLTRRGVYTYRDTTLSVDQFLEQEGRKILSNRGYLTVARDIRRLFQLLGFLILHDNKSGELTTTAIELLATNDPDMQKRLWKNAFMQLCLEGTDGEISHPYRILIKLVRAKPGIETKKLMLTLEAENDSNEEYERILGLSNNTFDEIITSTGTSESMAKNAVKILPGIAEQLGDIVRRNNNSLPVGEVVITEDEITTIIPPTSTNIEGIPYSQYRTVTSENIARDPIFNAVSQASVDLTESIRIRQERLAKHQEIVRKISLLCEQNNFTLYEGKFDCLSTQAELALLFEIKTILDNLSDQEKQTIKGVGQLKYYKFSIVSKQMNYRNVKEFLVYSQKPSNAFIEFCKTENISVIWNEGNNFKTYDFETETEIEFNPSNFV